jgi:hypothetical protein
MSETRNLDRYGKILAYAYPDRVTVMDVNMARWLDDQTHVQAHGQPGGQAAGHAPRACAAPVPLGTAFRAGQSPVTPVRARGRLRVSCRLPL